MLNKEREYRNLPFELKEEDNKKIVEGRAIVYNMPTVMFEMNDLKYYEVIDSRALEGADLSDVIMNINHEGRPVARLRNNTLTLENKSDALHIKADLSGTELGRNLFEEIKGGYIDKMSFAFSIKEAKYDNETRTRTITKIKKVYDVSAVNIPAYESTSIQARSFFEEEYSKEIEAVEHAKALEEKRSCVLERINKIWTKNDY